MDHSEIVFCASALSHTSRTQRERETRAHARACMHHFCAFTKYQPHTERLLNKKVIRSFSSTERLICLSDRQIDRQTDNQTDISSDRQRKERQADNQTDRQSDRQTNRQTDIQKDNQTDI